MEAPALQHKQQLLCKEAFDLLQQLIKTPSFSKEEQRTAELIFNFLEEKKVKPKRHLNNVWSRNKFYDPAKPTLLLNSHHDTVKPNAAYSLDPFGAVIKDGKLIGLGSNDAGASLVSLLACFLHFYDAENLKYNLIYAASAEEEISGPGGMEALLPELGAIDCGIVGEPTQMHMAVAEKGLLVLDCVSHGEAGHAARNEGDNAIYHAMEAIKWFSTHQFKNVSPLLGPVKMSVTSISTENKAHNVIPSSCRFTVDIRVNELYTFEQVLDEIKQNVSCDIAPRSIRLRPSSISMDHPLVKSGLKLNRSVYGSPTTSDKALMPFPTLKMGPGDSARSHTADEFIYPDELTEGIQLYIQLLENIL
ncbi:MAG: M20 family metallo-hydrolase [Bacteroidia bacterium]